MSDKRVFILYIVVRDFAVQEVARSRKAKNMFQLFEFFEKYGCVSMGHQNVESISRVNNDSFVYFLMFTDYQSGLNHGNSQTKLDI